MVQYVKGTDTLSSGPVGLGMFSMELREVAREVGRGGLDKSVSGPAQKNRLHPSGDKS